MLVDHLFQYGISSRPKTAEKRGFCTCLTDGPSDGRTKGHTDQQKDRQMDRPSYRDARTHLKSVKEVLMYRQIRTQRQKKGMYTRVGYNCVKAITQKLL